MSGQVLHGGHGATQELFGGSFLHLLLTPLRHGVCGPPPVLAQSLCWFPPRAGIGLHCFPNYPASVLGIYDEFYANLCVRLFPLGPKLMKDMGRSSFFLNLQHLALGLARAKHPRTVPCAHGLQQPRPSQLSATHLVPYFSGAV